MVPESSPGTSLADVLTAIGAVATAVISLFVLVVAVIAFQHTRAGMGMRRSVRIRPARTTWRPERWTVPTKEDPAELRGIGLNLLNVSPTPKEVSLFTGTTRLWSRPFSVVRLYPMEDAARVGAHRHATYQIVLAGMVGERTHCRLRLVFELSGGEKITFKGRVKLWPVVRRTP